jgi:hypothetical protein
MNSYKIDWNRYSSTSFPVALYARSSWWRRWEHVSSFTTIEEAKEHYAKLAGLPVRL